MRKPEEEWLGEPIVVPPYYYRFHCLGGQCRHSCCIGWEIGIDPESLHRFLTMQGSLGQKLRHCIEITSEGAHFRLAKGKRCPFLNTQNLCEIILRKGENSICGICRQHPRFVNECGDHLEVGLGLCCEEAARLILSWPEPKSEMPRERKVSLRFVASLERMSSDWTRLLVTASAWQRSGTQMDLPRTEGWRLAWQNLLDVLLYRYHEERYAEWAWSLIRLLCRGLLWQQGLLVMEDLIEVCRLYSCEIEYSDENVHRVMEMLSSSAGRKGENAK